MHWIAKISFYFRSLFSRRKQGAEMTEEMRVHLEMEAEAKIAVGMSLEEARYAALREFGNVASIQERTREERGWVWLGLIGKDIGFATRSLILARGFTLTVLATLTVGIGVATVVFQLTAWILFKTDPYPQPEQLYLIGYKDKQSPFTPVRSGLAFQAYQERTDVFSEFAAVKREMANILIAGEPSAVNVTSTSLGYFHTLGIVPALGRPFNRDEFKPGANNVVVISDFFWRKNFNADPQVLGRKLLLDQQVCTVVGVLKQSQPFPPAFEGAVFQPLVMNPNPADPFNPMLYIIGRLKPGVPPDAARTALAGVKVEGLPVWAVPFLADQEVKLMKPSELARPETYWVMAIAGGFLYLIACLNTVNLTLVRLLGRQRELSIRLSVGATRWQIIRLLAIESVGLTLTVMALLVCAARWLFPLIFAAITQSEEVGSQPYLWSSLGPIGILSVVAGLTAVIVPTLRLLRADLNPTLKESGAGMGESRRLGRMRNFLVVLQASFAVILLVGTGLMVRSFEKLQRVDLGFNPIGRVKINIAFPKNYTLEPEARLQLFENLRERLAKLPGVKAASCGQDTLLEGFAGTAQVQMPDGQFQPCAGNFVAADFLKTSGLILKRGRWVSEKRGEGGVVINESLAKARFGNEDPIGKSIKLLVSGDHEIPVTGVVGNVKETVRTAVPGLRIYFPSWAYPANINSALLLLDKDPGPEFGGLVRHAIYAFNPKLIVTSVSSIDEAVRDSMWAERYAFRIMKGLTTIALILVIVGLFSVVSYTVASRRQEFGVRMALGATPMDLHRLVLKRGLVNAGLGVVLGTAIAIGLTRFMQSLLFETTPYDPGVYVVVAVFLLGAAMAACWLPARRAARVDPVVALRAE